MGRSRARGRGRVGVRGGEGEGEWEGGRRAHEEQPDRARPEVYRVQQREDLAEEEAVAVRGHLVRGRGKGYA